MWGVVLFISATLVFSLLINIAFGHRSYWRAKRLRQQRDASSVCGACTSPTSQSSQSRGPAEAPLPSALSPRAAAQYFMDHGLPSHLVASQLLPFLTPYEVTVVAQVNRFFRNVTSPLAPYWAEALDRLPPIDGVVPVANRPRRVSRRYYFQRVAQYPYELCGGHMSAASCRVVIAAKVGARGGDHDMQQLACLSRLSWGAAACSAVCLPACGGQSSEQSCRWLNGLWCHVAPPHRCTT